MKSMLNNTCISALLCGVIIVAAPAFAEQAISGGSTGALSAQSENTPTGTINTATATNSARSYAPTNTGANSGASVSTGGVSATGDVNSADASNNAGSVDHATQSSASQTHKVARNNAGNALNQQAGAGTTGSGSAGASVH
jgi:hypothetical protein